ncbi:MAG: acetate kinase [Bacilli bacterium]|mgnify:CR=1 FL=1|nr:acetate kinase [Bacilli bacterium]MDD7315770.1 acetate kinase [Bacilli bacterium]
MFKIMAVNAGSSSLKFQLLEMPEETVITEGLVERIGLEKPNFVIKYNGEKEEREVKASNHEEAVQILLDALLSKGILKDLNEISGVGHRVLHCGERYTDSVIMDDEAISVVESVNDLGPLHNPANLTGIRAFRKILPNVVQVGVFDTSFHLTMADEAYMYAVPYEWYENYHVRKYGFHGTSYKYVSAETAKRLGQPIESFRMIIAHLGNGASLAAIKDGHVVDTSMGLTPLDGIPMGTRSGSIDPAIIEYISRKANLTVNEINTILNKKSGYIGFHHESSDARDLRKAQAEGDKKADLILRMQEKRIVDYIGSYYAYMGGCDVLVFTAGIGEKSAQTRLEICKRLEEPFGIKIDEKVNEETFGKFGVISTKDSKIKVLVVPTNEELMIARDVMRLGNIK